MRNLKIFFIGAMIIIVLGCSIKGTVTQGRDILEPVMEGTTIEKDGPEYTDPQEIIRNSEKKYRQLQYFSSTGSGRYTTVYPSGSSKEDRAALRIEMTSPDQLKLNWTEDGTEKEFTVSNHPEKSAAEAEESSWDLTMAVNNGGKRKFLIARGLFSPTSNMKSVLDIIEDPRLTGRDEIELQDCYVIKGRLPRNMGEMTLWIGVNDLIVRRIQQHFPLKKGAFYEVEETYSDIEMR